MTPANRGKRLTKTFAAPVVVAVVRQGAAGRLWKVGDQVDKHEVVFASRSVGPHRGVSILDRAPGRSEGCRYRGLEVLGPLPVSLWYPTPTSNTQTTTYQP